MGNANYPNWISIISYCGGVGTQSSYLYQGAKRAAGIRCQTCGRYSGIISRYNQCYYAALEFDTYPFGCMPFQQGCFASDLFESPATLVKRTGQPSTSSISLNRRSAYTFRIHQQCVRCRRGYGSGKILRLSRFRATRPVTLRRTVKTSNKPYPVFFQFRVLERGPIPFWRCIYCFWASMKRATHIPRPTGGDAGISGEALRPVREKFVPDRTSGALPWIVEVLQAPRLAE